MDHHSLIRNATLISIAFIITAYLICGPHGMLTYYKNRLLVMRKQEKIAHLERTITTLSHTVDTCQHHPFALEKSARYDYGMGYTNEMIYIVPPKAR
jgi:cell division protein FtsB